MPNQRGDDAEFLRACMPHRPMMLRVATRLTRDRASAEDVVQDALIRALRAWGSFRPEGDPTTAVKRWLMRVVTNTFLNQVKAEQSVRRRVADLARQSEISRDEEPIRWDAGPELRTALDQIPAMFAETVYRHHILEQSVQEVAEAMGVPPGTVLSRLCRGIRHLRDVMGARRDLRRRAPKRSLRAREVADGAEATEVVKAQADCVGGIVGEHDACDLVRAEQAA